MTSAARPSYRKIIASALGHACRSGWRLADASACVAAGALSLAYAYSAAAQQYPNRPIRFVASGVGSSADQSARDVAQGLSAALNQSVIVDNRLSLLSAEIVAKAAPDGYTLLATGNSVWVAPLIQQVSYDVLRDFVPITVMARSVLILALNNAVPANSVKDLIALAKSKPGVLNYAHSGTGGPAHLAGELFKYMAGVNIISVPYKGGSPALNALISGEVQLLINAASQIGPQAKAGKLKALAVTSLNPSLLAPGLPTVAASGLPGYEAIGFTACFVPSKTPASIVNLLNREVVRHLNQPEVKERFLNSGLEIVADSSQESLKAIKADIERVSKLIKETNLKMK